MRPRHTATVLAVAPALVALVGGVAQAQQSAEGVTAQQVIRGTVDHSPDLRASLLDLERARLAVEREDNLFVPSFTADLGYTHGTSATRARSGDGVTLLSQDGVSLSLGLQQEFATGTQARLSVELDRSVTDSLVTGDLGVGYGVSTRLTVTQPWLRGAGDSVIRSGFYAATTNRDASTWARDRNASALLRDTITQYWELWYNQQAVGIRREALDVARQQLAVGEQRVQAGVLAADELLPLQTEVASAEEDILTAEADIRQRSIALARRLGRLDAPWLRADDPLPPLPGPDDLDGAAQRAMDNSPTLHELALAIEAAEIDVAVVDDRQQWRLDTTAWLQVGGAGNTVGSTFEQFGSFDVWSVFLGVSLELPLDNTALSAESQRAHLAIQSADTRYQAESERIRSDVASRVDALRASYTRLDYAERTGKFARASVESQRKRFEAGSATAIDVVRVLQQQREADLRALRLRVDIINAHTALDDITGDLLVRTDLRGMISTR